MRKSIVIMLCALACGLGAAPVLAKDTGLIFVSNEKTSNIIAIDPATYKVVKDIKVARRPRDMHFSSDHSKLYVACGDDDVIDILDVAKLQVAGKLKTGPSPEAFGIDEKRGRVYVSDEEGRRSPSSIWSATPSCRRCRPAPSRKACWSATMARSSMSPPKPAI